MSKDEKKNQELTLIHTKLELSDDEHLARLGYKAEFKREFSSLSTISFAFSIMASVIWCWAIGGFFCCFLAASIAEIVSAYPTSGGLYSASAYLVPARAKPLTGYLIGWLNLLGQVSGVASTEFSLSRFIWAAVVISKDGDYEVTNAKLWGLYAALLVFHGIINCLPTKSLAVMTSSFVFINLGTVLAIIIALLIKTPAAERHTRGYTFGNLFNESGWSSSGLAFLFGLLSVQWTMTDYDATAHISEEVKRAAIAAPVAICVAVVGTGLFGWVYNVVLVLCSGDIANLPGPSGLSVATILSSQINKPGFYVLWTGCALTANFIVITALQANSRSFFAFSRDYGMGGGVGTIFGKLTAKKVPVNSVILIVVLCMLLGLLQFASATALNAIFSLCAIALDCSYAVPIACKVIFANHPEVNYRPGPFSLGTGIFGRAVNCIAVTWVAFVSIIFVLPTLRPVTPQNMNYASVLTIGTLVLSFIYYLISARRYYSGPRNFTGGSFAETMARDGNSVSSGSSDPDSQIKRGVGTEIHV